MSHVTLILERARAGDPAAVGELLPFVYDELRRLAAHRMAGEAGGHTLQPTALVHEAWLRLGEAREKLNDRTAARSAYEKFLEVAADNKEAPAIRKKLESWPAGGEKKQ